MADLTDQEAVEAALGRILTVAETSRFSSLLGEASALIVGHLGCEPDPIPDPVKLVAARVIARVFQQSADVGVEGSTEQVGPFARTLRFGSGTTSGAPWLTVPDKVSLRPYRCGAFRSVPYQSSQSGRYRTYD